MAITFGSFMKTDTQVKNGMRLPLFALSNIGTSHIPFYLRKQAEALEDDGKERDYNLKILKSRFDWKIEPK